MVQAESPVCRKGMRERKLMEHPKPLRAKMADKINGQIDLTSGSFVRDDSASAQLDSVADVASHAGDA